MLKSMKPVLPPRKESFLEFSKLSGCFVPRVPARSALVLVCIENGENSEKNNHILSATSHFESNFLTKLLNMSKFQNRLILLYQKVPLQGVGLGLFPSDSLESQSYEFIEIAHTG